MIPTDPVNLLDPSPFGPLSYYTHMIIGTLGLIAAIVAMSVTKGNRIHIWAGRMFIFSIMIVAITSLAMLSLRMAPPLLVAALTAIYAVATAYLALKPATKAVKRSEYGLFFVECAVLVVFMIMAGANIAAGNINPIGPIVIAFIPMILLAGDINFFRKSDQRSRLRVRRHLARMIWAFVIAIRAPITEFYQELSLSVGIILFAPLVIAPAMIGLCLRRAYR